MDPGHFDFLFASPPCTLYSITPAHIFTEDAREARAEQGNAITRRTREILDWLKPKHYVIENPHSSAIWRQGIFDDLPKVVVSYCMYGFKYRKNTRLATSVGFDAKRCDGNCGNIRTFTVNGKTVKRHVEVAKQGVDAFCKRNGLEVQTNTHTQDQLYRVPERLIRDILEACLENLGEEEV